VIEDDGFFDGRYRGKVITVHSNIRGEEKDAVVQQLLTVEDAENPVEIVIHVNMLKEGWDVTNLYSIVPLRAANSRTLVEQSIGRGLRLPYGKRVGNPAVDRLTIVSHDRFQEIIDHANDPDSIIRAGIVIGRDIPESGKKAVVAESRFERLISGASISGDGEREQVPAAFATPEAQEVAKAVYQVIPQFERLRGSGELQQEDAQQKIVRRVEEMVRPRQGGLEGIVEKVDVGEVVKKATELYREMSIDISKIIVVPGGEAVAGYETFDLDCSGIHLQPVSQDILIQHLHENRRFKLRDGSGIVEEKLPEDYLVRGLIAFNDISYDDHASLLYKLSGEAVAHLRSYLGSEEDVINVLQYHQQPLVNLIYSQMQAHFEESASEYEVHVTKGFRTLRPISYTAHADEDMRNLRTPVPEGEKSRIADMVFGGFRKCLYDKQKFDTDSERRFAVILENDEEVLKWTKPAKHDFQIPYSLGDYEPDFVVETRSHKIICEPKRTSQMADDVVLAKAKAAAAWCERASAYSKENGDKEWRYLLIPHDQISEQMSLSGLAARYTYQHVDEGK